MAAKRKMKEQDAAEIDPPFVPVVEGFAKERYVSRESRKASAPALKVKGRIFAIMSSKDKFAAKLSKKRVDEL
jgi:hypothetical protein